MKYTKEEKKEYFKKQMDELKFQIEDKISDFINNSEELKAFIAFRRQHFYSYSLNNSMLIYKQLPSATFVAGYQKWKSLGYQVKKGSKSLKILIPMIRNDKEEDKKVIYGFKTGKVFDISQVEAQNDAVGIPKIDLGIEATPSTKIGLKSILGGIKKFIEQHCQIEEYEDDNGILGKTDGKKIYIADNPNPVDKASILVHEFFHFRNHFKENRKELSKSLKESEAELCTLIFGSYFNFNIDGAYKYLSMYREDRNIIECFEKAYLTFSYILEGNMKYKGLEAILQEEK